MAPSKGFALQRRYVGAAGALFLVLLIYVWQGRLISEKFTRTFRPAQYHHRLEPQHISQSLLCPRGLGQLRNATAAPSVEVPKVVGLVFYGRRATVSILDCYLKVSAPGKRRLVLMAAQSRQEWRRPRPGRLARPYRRPRGPGAAAAATRQRAGVCEEERQDQEAGRVGELLR